MEMESPSTVDRGLDQESSSPSQGGLDSSVINPLSLEEGHVSENMFDAGSSSSSSSSSVPLIVHSNPADFLPIKTEIKKMGVEISDERAEQLKNDVRRLSPEVVSLRERTLGEISLTPDSSFFEADEDQENGENEEENSGKLALDRLECDPTIFDSSSASSSASNLVKCNEAIPGSSVKNSPCSDLDRDECVSADVLVPLDHRTVQKTEISVTKFEGALNTSQNSANLTTSTSRGVIQKLQENEEIVFTGVNVPHVQLQASSSSSSSSSTSSTFSSSSSSSTSSSPTTNTINFMIAYPEASRYSSTDCENADRDPLRDHGETEGTDSDCSEQNPLPTNVLNAVIITDGAHLELQDQGNATEGEIILSCDRIERIEPEQFTEDSAESLALATGNRDEVRSDGSDSGLGGEITSDHNGNQAGNAPESDSETSFLDRIPDDILSDKDKTASSQLDGFVQVPGITETLESCQVQRPVLLTTPILPALRSPPKSNLKRRLTDCMEGEPNPKRINPDESQKKKRNIHFDAVTVYYFPRAQGFTCVPSQGGSTLGMSAAHTHAERFSLTEHAAEQRRIHRARLAQLRSERAANNVVEAASSSEDPSDDTDEEPSDAEELDIDSYYFLLPVPTWQRRALLRAAGVQKIDTVEKDECRDIRASRKHCGCGCKGYCDPESCPCSRAHVKCQVDRAGFPCGCSRDGCANSSGRIEFNPVRVRTHFIHTLMRLELEKKHRDEDCPDLRDLDNQQPLQGPLRDIRGLPIPSVDPSCSMNGSGFTTLHYPTPPDIGSCQSELPRPREDSLDLYAIRDDCYPASEDAVNSVGQVQNHHNHHQRKLLHPAEFGQTFQAFSTPGNNPSSLPSSSSGVQQQFQQNNYQDYQVYQTLPSTSRGQFHPQFQQNHTNQEFNHYVGYVGENTIAGCHQQQNLYDSGNFSQDDGSPSQYTNLNSVQQPTMIGPANSVVHNSSHQQIIGKLEPFSELLAGRYSYYSELEQQTQNHGSVYAPNSTGIKSSDGVDNDDKIIVNENNSTAMTTTTTTTTTTPHEETQGGNISGLNNTESAATAEEECDDNFGEIIKKSMVETVSA